MKKHAYLIIAHNNLEQLQYLISKLDDDRNDIYIMLDSKFKIKQEDKETLETFTKSSKMILTDRISVHWGGYSQVKAECILFETAHSCYNYDYYHLLSGSDLPLVSQDVIHEFFDKNPNKIFATLVDDKLFEKNNAIERVKYYYFFESLNSRSVTNPVFRKLLNLYRKAELKIQKIIRIDRTKKINCKVSYASNWLSLDQETVELLINNKLFIEKTFKNTRLTDELFIPTLINKFGLQNKYFYTKAINDLPEEFQGNLRYINWWDGSPHTWEYTDKDVGQLKCGIKLGHFFSRKFDLSKNPEYKEVIDNLIRKD